MFLTPNINQWGFVAGNWTTLQPNEAGMGVIVTNGNGSYGSWVEVVPAATLTEHCYEIAIMFNAGFTTNTNRQQIANVGIDPAGGSSYTTIIPNLLCSKAGTLNSPTVAGINYVFPIFIPAGSSIAVQTYGNSADTVRVIMMVKGKPSRPELLKTGSKVVAYGVVAPTGTPATGGTTSDGEWSIRKLDTGLTFGVAGVADANIQYVNDVAVTGNGKAGTEWGPA